MKGATVAMAVALVAWAGVWAYLMMLNGRLREALAAASLETGSDAPAPRVVVEQIQAGDDER